MAHAVAELGPLKGARVVAFMVAWETSRSALGDAWPVDAGVDVQLGAHADWWRESKRTAWRDLRRFRACFPGEDTPTRLMVQVGAQWDRARGVRGLGGLPLPA